MNTYHLRIEMNGQVFEMDTDNLSASILSVKPARLLSSVKIKVTKGNVVRDRFMYAPKGRMLFTNRYTLEAFIRNLLLDR